MRFVDIYMNSTFRRRQDVPTNAFEHRKYPRKSRHYHSQSMARDFSSFAFVTLD
jgi:hypothetical protein